MATTNQIKSYVKRSFPGLTAQCSVHGCHAGSILVYGPGIKNCDISTMTSEWGNGEHSITLAELGRHIRESIRSNEREI